MGRPTSSKKASVALQIEIEFGGVCNIPVYYSPCLTIATVICILLSLREEPTNAGYKIRSGGRMCESHRPNMVSFSDDYDGNFGVDPQVTACLCAKEQ